MQLNLLTIEGYKNLENLTIDFSTKEGIALIIGNNGSGKSNIIEAISAIFAGLYKRNAPRFKPPFKYQIAYSIGDRAIEIGYDGRKFSYCVNGLWKRKGEFFNQERDNLPSQVVAAYSGEETRLYTRFYEVFYNDFKYWYLKSGQAVQKQMYVNKYYWQLALLTLIYAAQNPVNTDAQQFLKTELGIDSVDEILLKVNPVKRENYFGTPTLDFIDQMDLNRSASVTITPDELYRRLDHVQGRNEPVETVNRWDTEKDFFNLIATAYLPKGKKIVTDISVRYNGNLTSKDFSEGEKKLILIKFMLEYLADENALVLLDEPDSHIHISRKQNLKNMLMTYKGRRTCVLTTHSPTLMECFPIKHHVPLTKDANGKAILNGHYNEVREAIENLTDGKWSYAEETIFTLTTKDIILAEGKNDARYLRRAIDALNNTKGNKFNPFDFTMAHCGGAGNVVAFFEDIVMPVLKPSQLCIALFDDDDAGRKAIIALQKIITEKSITNIKFLTYPKSQARVDAGAKDFLLEDHFPVTVYKQKMEQKLQSASCFSDLNSLQKAKDVIENAYLDFDDNDFATFEPVLDKLMAMQTAFRSTKKTKKKIVARIKGCS